MNDSTEKKKWILITLILLFPILWGHKPTPPVTAQENRFASSSCFPSADFAALRLASSATADSSLGDHRIDFDGDGATDVFSIAPDGTWRFSSGARQPWQTLRQESLPLEALRFGDFDGDGRTDVFHVQEDGQWRFSPGGRGDWVDLAASTLPLEALRLGNFDDDGRTDLFYRSDAGQWYFSSAGQGEWQALAGSGFPLAEYRFADFDADGKTDIFRVGAGILSDGNWFISYGGRTPLQLVRAAGIADVTRLRFGNVDDTPGADVLYAAEDGKWIAFSSGAGEPDPLSSLPFAPEELRPGDFNGDGRADLLRQETSGRWQVSFTIDGRWRLLFPTVEGEHGRLTCLSGATEAGRISYAPAISADGQSVVFVSDSDFLGDGIPAAQSEIWRYDVAEESLERLTRSENNRDSLPVSLSADGQSIVFAGDADFLGQGIPENQHEIWHYDVPTGKLTRLTTSTPGRDSFSPAISADGKAVVFESDADFLEEGIPAGQIELWRYDMTTGVLTRLTTSTPGRGNFNASVSGNGQQVVFESTADFLNQGIPANQTEIWLVDLAAGGTLRRLTTSGPGRNSAGAAISADGKTVVFESNADFLGEGIPLIRREIWRYDVPTGELTRLTTGADGRVSSAAAVSADGKTIVFMSNADFLGQGIPVAQFEIWRYETAVEGGILTRLTSSGGGRISSAPTISADGRRVALVSNADFSGHGSEALEVWLHQNHLPPPPLPPGEAGLYLPLVIIRP